MFGVTFAVSCFTRCRPGVLSKPCPCPCFENLLVIHAMDGTYIRQLPGVWERPRRHRLAPKPDAPDLQSFAKPPLKRQMPRTHRASQLFPPKAYNFSHTLRNSSPKPYGHISAPAETSLPADSSKLFTIGVCQFATTKGLGVWRGSTFAAESDKVAVGWRAFEEILCHARPHTCRLGCRGFLGLRRIRV